MASPPRARPAGIYRLTVITMRDYKVASHSIRHIFLCSFCSSSFAILILSTYLLLNVSVWTSILLSPSSVFILYFKLFITAVRWPRNICKMLLVSSSVFTLELLLRTKSFIEVNSWERCPGNYNFLQNHEWKQPLKAVYHSKIYLTSRCVNLMKT